MNYRVRVCPQPLISVDLLARKHRLSNRQKTVLGHALEHGGLTIQDFEALCPKVNRRTLQRELKAMVDKRILATEGATNRLFYRLREPVA